MKYLFSLLLLFVSLSVFAQEPPYTPMRLNYQFRGIRVDSLFLIPNYVDTSAANGSLSKRIAGSFIRTGNDFWMRNSDTSAWLQNVNVGSGASPTLNFVNNVFKKSGTDSVFYVVAPADTFFSFKDLGVDTTSLSNRIDLKVDSIKRSNDSVYFKRSGVWSFGYKDSLGQPVNFANSNLRATGNRSHSFANYGFTIDSAAYWNITSKTTTKTGVVGANNGEPYMYSIDWSDGSQSNIYSTKDSAFVGGQLYGDMFGLTVNADNSNVSLRRASNIAYLSTRNFGIDTIALKSDITSGQNFANANLEATGNRTHNFKYKNLLIDSLKTYELKSGNSLSNRSYFKMDGNNVNFYSYSAGGAISGLILDPAFNTISLVNKNNLAYLSNKNFVEDTLAFISDIKADSPDRIDGTATSDVTADMNGATMRFSNASQWKVDGTGTIAIEADSGLTLMSESMQHKTQGNKYEFKDFNNTFLRIDTLGNFEAGDLNTNQLTIALSKNDSAFQIQSKAPTTWMEKNSGLTSQVKTAYAEQGISTTGADYDILVPGVYIISAASLTYDINLPDPSLYKGQSIQIVNTAANKSGLASAVGSIFDRGTGATFTYVTENKMMVLYSDGGDWYGFEL